MSTQMVAAVSRPQSPSSDGFATARPTADVRPFSRDRLKLDFGLRALGRGRPPLPPLSVRSFHLERTRPRI